MGKIYIVRKSIKLIIIKLGGCQLGIRYLLANFLPFLYLK